MRDHPPISTSAIFAVALLCGSGAFLYTLYSGAPRRGFDSTASAAMSARRAVGTMMADLPQPRDRIGLEKAAAENPDSYGYFFDLARIAESQGDTTAAVKYFGGAADLAGKVEPGNLYYLRATFIAAWSHDRLGHTAESRSRFRIAADGYAARLLEFQNNRGVFQRLGWSHAKLGESAAAQDAWSKALKILTDRTDPLSPEDQYDVGCLLALTGQTDAAFSALDSALAKGFAEPEWTRADEDLESLHADPRFKSLLMRMEDRHSRRRAGE